MDQGEGIVAGKSRRCPKRVTQARSLQTVDLGLGPKAHEILVDLSQEPEIWGRNGRGSQAERIAQEGGGRRNHWRT